MCALSMDTLASTTRARTEPHVFHRPSPTLASARPATRESIATQVSNPGMSNCPNKEALVQFYISSLYAALLHPECNDSSALVSFVL